LALEDPLGGLFGIPHQGMSGLLIPRYFHLLRPPETYRRVLVSGGCCCQIQDKLTFPPSPTVFSPPPCRGDGLAQTLRRKTFSRRSPVLPSASLNGSNALREPPSFLIFFSTDPSRRRRSGKDPSPVSSLRPLSWDVFFKGGPPSFVDLSPLG